MTDGGNAMADMDIDGEDNKENHEDEESMEEYIAPFTKLSSRGRKLLKWIPVVMFFGMGEDGYYSIHIKEGCMKKTSKFIEKNLPGYKFHFVPFGENESIHLLVSSGCPLHSSGKGSTCNDVGCIATPHGTVGCIAILVDKDNKPSKEIYVLTANHVVEKCEVFGGEYITWTKENPSVKHKIGTEVPFKIPLVCRSVSRDSGICVGDQDTSSEWNDPPSDEKLDQEAEFMEQKIADFESYFETKNDLEDNPQYDIACIQVDGQSSNNTGTPSKWCSCCINSEKVCEPKSLIGSDVQKVERSAEPLTGKIMYHDAAVLVALDRKTVWVSDITVMGSASEEQGHTEYISNEGDSGSIVCKLHEGKRDWSNSFMIFAGWKNASDAKCSKSLAFSLNDAITQLTIEQKKRDPNFNKTFRFSCCEKDTEVGNNATLAPQNQSSCGQASSSTPNNRTT